MKINGLILAAGNSSRLGHDKQLVQYQGVSLIRHIEKTLEPLVNQLYVALGHNHVIMQGELKSAIGIINQCWQHGIGDSLACGVKAAKADADAILIALCDQPRIPQSHYQKMITMAQQHPTRIIATGYAGICGVPVIFPELYFNELFTLTGPQGARGIIGKYPDEVMTLGCDAAEFDVDCKTQVEQL